MNDTLTIIIPAGGQAARFNGIIKELLPIQLNSATGLSHSIDLARKLKADQIRIISNDLKLGIHRKYIRESIATAIPITINAVLETHTTLWDALQIELLDIQRGGLLLPDTITDFFVPEFTSGIQFGVFDTYEPERFSIIENDRIITKPDNKPVGVYKAWGVVLWSKEVTHYMLHNTFNTYDAAFQAAMDTFGYNTFPLHYYYDLANAEEYMQYILDYAAHTELVIC